MDPTVIFWIFFILLILYSKTVFRMKQIQRYRCIKRLEKERKTRVIVMIHRQEQLTLFGIPIYRFITIEDSEEVLRAIRMTPEDMPIDLILHTPGGLVLASEQIAMALKEHKAKTTVIVPHYAMSGGTLIALAADEIIMDKNAVLGPVDPQIGNYPAASILKVVETKYIDQLDDETLILADISRKAISQVKEFVYNLLKDKMPEEKAREVAEILSTGRWTHDYPLTVDKLRELGIEVNTNVPKLVYKLFDLYKQPTTQRPSVQYIPVPYRKVDHVKGKI